MQVIFSISCNVLYPIKKKFWPPLICSLQALSIWISLKFCRVVKAKLTIWRKRRTYYATHWSVGVETTEAIALHIICGGPLCKVLTPWLHRAIADKSVVFLSKVGMEPTKTDLQLMSHIGHLFSTYQKLLGKDECNRQKVTDLDF